MADQRMVFDSMRRVATASQEAAGRRQKIALYIVVGVFLAAASIARLYTSHTAVPTAAANSAVADSGAGGER